MKEYTEKKIKVVLKTMGAKSAESRMRNSRFSRKTFIKIIRFAEVQRKKII
jgi:hypothetical protein